VPGKHTRERPPAQVKKGRYTNLRRGKQKREAIAGRPGFFFDFSFVWGRGKFGGGGGNIPPTSYSTDNNTCGGGRKGETARTNRTLETAGVNLGDIIGGVWAGGGGGALLGPSWALLVLLFKWGGGGFSGREKGSKKALLFH